MDENKTIKYLAYIGVFVFILAVGWYLLREPDVHDQRERTSDITESLGRVGEEQRNAESNLDRIERGLDDSIGRADEIAERISDAESAITASQERRGECEKLISDSESRIAESKSIIQGIRERSGQDGK